MKKSQDLNFGKLLYSQFNFLTILPRCKQYYVVQNEGFPHFKQLQTIHSLVCCFYQYQSSNIFPIYSQFKCNNMYQYLTYYSIFQICYLKFVIKSSYLLIIFIIMQPVQPQQQEAPVFKGDLGSVSDSITAYLNAETQYYIEYLGSIGNSSFDNIQYMNWRYTQNKVNSHRFFLPLVDAVILDLYIYQNLQISQDQGFSVGFENYLAFKDQVRQSLVMLDPYLIACSYTQTAPSYSGYQQWTLYQQNRSQEIQKLRNTLIPLNTVTFREDVFTAFVMNDNNPLTVNNYQQFYEGYLIEEKGIQRSYEDYIQQLRKSIQDINLFVFNNYVKALEIQGLQVTKQGYEEYFQQVLKKYDAEYLKSQHEKVLETEKQSQDKKGKVEKKVQQMNQEQEQLAQQLQDIEEKGEAGQQESEDVQEQDEKQAEIKIQLSKQCPCCKGKVYECEGEVCKLLGNCICLSE